MRNEASRRGMRKRMANKQTNKANRQTTKQEFRKKRKEKERKEKREKKKGIDSFSSQTLSVNSALLTDSTWSDSYKRV